MKRISRPALALALGALLVAALLGLPSLAWPFGPAQAQSFALALDWWQRDLLPYRNVSDSHLPGIHFVYLLAQMIFGAHPFGIRLFELMIIIASARTAAQAAVRRKVTLEEFAPVAVFCAASYFTFADPGDSAREETWGAICMLAAQAAVCRDRNRRRAAMVSGLWCGSALMLQPRCAIFLPLIAAQLIWLGLKDRPEPEKAPTLVEIPLAFLAGTIQPPFFFASYFFSHKAAGPFYRAVVQALEVEGAWPPLPPSLWPFIFALALWAVALAARARKGGIAATWPSGVTLLFLACALLASHGAASWLMALPALWVCAADGLLALAMLGDALPTAATAVLAAALIVLAPAWRVAPQRDFGRQAIGFYSGRG